MALWRLYSLWGRKVWDVIIINNASVVLESVSDCAFRTRLGRRNTIYKVPIWKSFDCDDNLGIKDKEFYITHVRAKYVNIIKLLGGWYRSFGAVKIDEPHIESNSFCVAIYLSGCTKSSGYRIWYVGSWIVSCSWCALIQQLYRAKVPTLIL